MTDSVPVQVIGGVLLKMHLLLQLIVVIDADLPKTIHEALNGSKSKKWSEAP